MDAETQEKLNFSFAGCGFMGIYHIGVGSCLREYAPQFITNNKISGASAGSMVACLLLCGAPLGYCTSWTLSLAAKARQRSLGPMHPSFNITNYLREGLEEILPADAHQRCTGKLHISMTRIKDMKNVIISEFESRQELIQGLLCSAFIPFWSGMVPPLFRDERCIDGALSDNLPRLDSYTCTVSPFCGRSDICPDDESLNIFHMYLSNTSVQFSVKNIYRISRIMFPPHPEKLSEICKRGFEDALAYLKRLGLVSCSRHLAVRSVLSRRTESICRDMNELAETEEELERQETCEHCVKKQQEECDLHPSVITALEEAIAGVNSGYLVYMKNMKPYRTFSVIMSPIYLPFDISLHIFSKIVSYLPRLHHDVKWIVEMLYMYAGLLSGKVITHGRHTYSAKFVCQLAITEIQHSDITADIVHSQTHDHKIKDQRIGFGVEVNTTRESRIGLGDRCLEGKNTEQIQLTDCRKDLLQPEQSRGINKSCPVSRVGSRAPSRAVSRRPSLSGSELTDNEEMGVQYINMFDKCVHMADQKDALLAYFYKDEQGLLKATEIFKMDNGDTMSRDAEVQGHTEPEIITDDPISMTCADKLIRCGSTRSVLSCVSMEDTNDTTPNA